MKIVKTSRGFTIVELLIVIVVIAILAAISIVAYTGIQNRAKDSTVQSEIANASKALQVFFTLNERYPQTSNEANATYNTFSTAAYANHANAIHYCYNVTEKTYAIGGVSASGKGFVYMNGAMREIPGWPQTSAVNICRNNFGMEMSTGSLIMYHWPNASTWNLTTPVS